ncbi:hypothetical protein BDN70DRAFT_935085 [Pholiota conissans]|uniref:Uncharacterized protein n=1 Tax=Pholiota conissans TaxID=109636 RepID=A0A9P6CY85_9AGAR|nr:hypothetical protein BDN70DRAFT_935085 [Pholiota conissans]
MPHKKAKRTVREKLRTEKGTDLAPGKDSLQNEAIPKSAARVFNSQAIRDDFKLKKRKMEEEGVGRAGKKQKTDKKVTLTIQPGESIQHFNRRVEDDLRPLVKSAAQSSRAFARGVAKAEHEARITAKKTKLKPKDAEQEELKPRSHDDSPLPTPSDKFKDRRKEFEVASSSTPKRLNDIAQAPPEFKKLPRGASTLPGIGKRDGVLSMSQKVMMEQEREKAILRYRELKAKRRQTGDVGERLESGGEE